MRADRTSVKDETGNYLKNDENTCIDSVTGLMIDCGSKNNLDSLSNGLFR